MLCIARIASCRTLSPAAVQLRKLVAGGETPDTAYACIAVIHSKNQVDIAMLCIARIASCRTLSPAASIH